jgi:chemotaxis protein CheC
MQADDLSDIERDALGELVNIAVSGAASRLRAMVGSEVSLTVPIVEVVGGTAAANSIADLGLQELVAVRQTFEGRLNGQTMLVFNDADADTLMRAVLGDGFSEEEYAELRVDTLGEIGNVLLLGLLATIGSMLGLTFDVKIPTVESAQVGHVFPPGEQRVIMLIHVNFSVRQIEARGYFALVMGLGSFQALREIVGAFLTKVMAE